jgi:SNF2 family DNA or RNA helicase
MIFKKWFSKNKQNVKNIISFDFDENSLYVTIDMDNIEKDIKDFLDITFIEFEDIIEKIGNNRYKLKHENIYLLQNEYLELFKIPIIFDGNMNIHLKGLINQGNANFLISFFKNEYELFPYKIVGSILKISNEECYLLPQNMYEIFKKYQQLNKNSEYDMYSFVGEIQDFKGDKISFRGLPDNDIIKSVSNITINIKETDNNDLLVMPTFDDLPIDKSIQYEQVLSNANGSLLIPNVEKNSNSITRYLLDNKDIKVANVINKTKIIKREEILKFMSNPTSFFNSEDDIVKSELEKIFDYGYRIIGIGKPYIGYFGSIKIDTPLSEVLKKDPNFSSLIDKEYIKEFIETNNDNLCTIIEQIEEAKNSMQDKLCINDTTIHDFEYDSYIEMSKKQILRNSNNNLESNSKEVLQIASNDESELIIKSSFRKPLHKISVNDSSHKNFYNDFEFTPKKHQIEALNWFIDLYKNDFKGCLLADDMGLGKTFQVITFLNYLIKNKKNSKILIVAPTILIDNWNNEFVNSLKQVLMENYKIKIIRGNNKALDNLELIIKGTKTKENAFSNIDTLNFVKDYNIYITTYKTLQRYQFAWAYMAEDANIGIECIVYDEAQNIKNPNALQTQAAKAISSLTNFNILLSGTPIENELRDIWCLFDVFDPLFFGSWKKFRQDFINNNNNIEERLRLKISNYMLRRLKTQVLDSLPKKYEPKIDKKEITHYPARVVNFTDEQKNKYFEIVNSSDTSLSKLHKLRVFSLHPLLLEAKTSTIEYFLKNDILNEFSKTKELVKILNDIKIKEEKVIIFVISKSMQLLLQISLTKYFGITIHVVNGDNNRANALKERLDNFRNTIGFNVIILSTLAAGVGLTLNEANHVIHYERHWNPAKEDQASDRVYRIGQNKDVYVHHIITKLNEEKSSFDQGLNQLIMQKKLLSDGALIPTHGITNDEIEDILFRG